MNYKIIELKGVGVKNKGAHLMLLSILKEFKEREKNSIFCIEPGFGMDYFIAAQHGFFLKTNFQWRKLPIAKMFSLFPKPKLRSYGLILDNQVEVILDGSGFAYGDYWGANKIESRLNNFLKNKTANNSKLILLPQALGPFHNPKVKKAFGKVVEKADLIFARDEVSYNHLIENYGERNNIKRSPDFTNLLMAGEVETYVEGNICVIPNYKMMPNEESKSHYYKFLENAILHIQELGEKPYFLIHEGEKDKEIALNLNNKLKQELSIVEPQDPVEIKNRIKSSKLIVVSRFHGLVSGLSQGVPVITTSWSHKYREVLKDYNLDDCLIDISNYDKNDLNSLIERHLNTSKEDYLKDQHQYIEKEKQKSSEMWNDIFKIIYG